ncbi:MULTISPECIES: M24 family metallopeptidase [unclassified Janthinobacterium]|uniref:M24 family metallopeptidase n=1 Tax=unclassified Janthinobacterium TaxID=2610881 RepID=UPI001610B67E|nr:MULTISPECIES: M24 family metallopeptidase [unclassified Janthinobacterium]MBB5369495.1 hypothetical protein [Janthinobacterium sp. K2C7]MBB5382549.1 hypothetical protein [Janthinobacterium sp. K2Li3]MBB5388126.1 hypothetical protein [Janthinobacterium sp. K2E3]
MNWPTELEVEHKLAQMRGWLEQQRAGGIRLRGADWFAWATAGASNSQNPMSPCGGAELLVTRDRAYILSDEAEAPCLREDALHGPWTWQVSPWMQPQLHELREHFVQHAAGGASVLSDLPRLHECGLPTSMREERLVLLQAEQQRYLHLGQLVASAASEALRKARPDWTERELAAACVRALWLRGVQEVHIIALGAQRQSLYRRAPASATTLGARAVLAVCARRHGLCASLSRQVRFEHAGQILRHGHNITKNGVKNGANNGIDNGIDNGNNIDNGSNSAAPGSTGNGATGAITDHSSVAHDDATLLALEAVALDTCVAGNALSMVYHALDSAYAYAGHPDTALRHRQGGIQGYLAPEVMASAHTEITLKRGMAAALHPSLPCGMVEDTFLIDGDHLRNLTYDPAWPSTLIQGRRRPLTLVLG